MLIFTLRSVCLLLALFAWTVPGFADGINWQTNYEAALSQAKNTKKPLFILFTMSEGCGYCTKLKEEALDTKEFSDKTENRFVFVKIDYSAPTQELRAQHDQLQRKYNIRGYPTVIILDPREEKQIGVTGYRPGGGLQYANHVLQFITHYSKYQQTMQHLDVQSEEMAILQEAELKELYQMAKKLNFSDDMEKIRVKGMQQEDQSFFLMEAYRQLVQNGKIQSKEALEIRQKLLALESNQKQIAFDVAIIDFENNVAAMEDNGCSIDKGIAPLTAYIEKFGSVDKENTWRLHLIISQVYLDKNQLIYALRYAQEGYEAAPLTARPKIARAIENIGAKIHA